MADPIRVKMASSDKARDLAEQINSTPGAEGPQAAVRGDEITMTLGTPLLLEVVDSVLALCRRAVRRGNDPSGDDTAGARCP